MNFKSKAQQARDAKTAKIDAMGLAELLVKANATATPAANGEFVLVVDGENWGWDRNPTFCEDSMVQALRSHLHPKVSNVVSQAQKKARRSYVRRYPASFL